MTEEMQKEYVDFVKQNLTAENLTSVTNELKFMEKIRVGEIFAHRKEIVIGMLLAKKTQESMRPDSGITSDALMVMLAVYYRQKYEAAIAVNNILEKFQGEKPC